MSTPNPLTGLPGKFSRPDVPQVSIAAQHGTDIFTATSSGGSPDQLYQAASISKPVAALAALALVQQGTLSLDSDINDQLTSWTLPVSPDWPVKVTLRNLLSHGAGLSVRSFPGYPQDTVLPGLTDILDGKPPAITPAVRVTGLPAVAPQYSGGGYTVLQQLIVDASGQPFDQVVQALVLDPLGMATARYGRPGPRPHAPAVALGNPVPGGYLVYPELAAAGLWCTPADLVQFATGIQNMAAGRPHPRGQQYPLSRELATEMLTEQLPGWGLGLELGGTGAGRRFGHEGDNEGYACELSATVAPGPAIAIMTASDRGREVIHPLLPHIRGLLSWPDRAACSPVGTPGDPPPSASLFAHLPTLYGGEYRTKWGTSLYLAGDGWNWTLTRPGQPPLPLEPKSLTWVACPVLPIEIEFDVDPGTGRANSFTLHQIGAEGPEVVVTAKHK
jgi:hypothetical protein